MEDGGGCKTGPALGESDGGAEALVTSQETRRQGRRSVSGAQLHTEEP